MVTYSNPSMGRRRGVQSHTVPQFALEAVQQGGHARTNSHPSEAHVGFNLFLHH